jgi:hypothetical protein
MRNSSFFHSGGIKVVILWLVVPCSSVVGNMSVIYAPLFRGLKPPIQLVPRALSLGVKCSGREADHSPPASAEVKE